MVEKTGSPFELWAQQEGIPIIRGYAVEDMYQIPLGRWERKGGLGAQIILEGGQGWTNAYLCEIPPKTSLKPQRHFFEERIYILSGQGETKAWTEGVPEQTFAWQEYSLFSPPLNTWHQHRNTGEEPVRYVAVTNAPIVFNVVRDPEFIYNCDYVFKGRYGAKGGYGDSLGEAEKENIWKASLIRDIRRLETFASAMGKHFESRALDLSDNTTSAHMAHLAPGTYKNAHRHAAGAHIIIVQGTGYSLMWEEGKEKMRTDWRKGSLLVPPEGWFHQHFNTGNEPMVMLALRRGMERSVGKMYYSRLDIKKGGDEIEYEDEEPEIRKLYEQELAKKGLPIKMPPLARS